jgi:hypothetical protein
MFKRSLGKDQVRGLTTSLPKDLRYRCDVKFTLKFYQMGDLERGYISLHSGYGSSIHKFHYMPNPGDLAVLKRHTTPAVQKFVRDSGDASIGSSAIRYLCYQKKNMFVNKSSL